MQTGITTSTEKRLFLDAGAVYRDYGEVGQALIGATKGGATFTVEREDRDVEVDGAKGPIKGLKRTIRHTARLEVTFIEFSQQTLLDLTRGTATSDGTHRTVAPDNAIAAGDFYTNIALVGEIMGTADPIIIKLLNALAAQEWEVTVDDQDEGGIAVTFEAHYASDDLNDPPYRILLPKNAT